MKKVVAIADLHVGSRVGLSTGWSNAEGKAIRSAILDKWDDSVNGPWKRPDILLVLGDCVDGPNKKEGGIGTTTNDMLEQADEAVELIKMWKAKEVYIIRGSGYHVSPSGSGLQVEEYIGRQLDAIPLPGQKKNRSVWHLYLTVDGYTFHMAHKIGVPKVFAYKSTPIARQVMAAKLVNQLKTYKVNMVLRAHCHSYVSVDYHSSGGMTLPCWKAMDDYAQREGSVEMVPDLGFVGFKIEDGAADWKKNLFHVIDVQPAPHIVRG